MDGVLADTSPCHRMAYDDLWADIGIDGPDYELIAGRRTVEVVRELTQELEPAGWQIDDWVRFKQQRAIGYIEHGPIVYPDVARNVDRLRRPYTLALGSGASRDSVDAVTQALGLADAFDAIRTASDVNNGKPDPEIYQEIMLACCIGPEHTLIVEDSAVGLAAAGASQAFHVSVRTGKTTDSARFLGAFPDLDAVIGGLGLV